MWKILWDDMGMWKEWTRQHKSGERSVREGFFGTTRRGRLTRK